MVGPVAFIPSRVNHLLTVKGPGFTMGDYIAQGFARGWVQRKTHASPPGRPHDAVRLALWLEVRVEYLFGAAPEYDSMETWEVAARASLEIFLMRHPEGADGRRYRDHFERHIEAYGERSPKTVATWAGWFDAFQRGRAQERSDAAALERAAPGAGKRRRPRR
ncbi:MAG: hypothetical protein ACREK6_00015 [Candidatus Rokuibacteriota bacterium]